MYFMSSAYQIKVWLYYAFELWKSPINLIIMHFVSKLLSNSATESTLQNYLPLF